MFVSDFIEDDIESPELGFSFAGKLILKKLLKVCFN